MIKDIIEQAEALEQRIHTLSLTKEEMEANAEEIRRLDQERTQLLAQCADLSAADRVYLARHPKRPHIANFLALLSDFSKHTQTRILLYLITIDQQLPHHVCRLGDNVLQDLVFLSPHIIPGRSISQMVVLELSASDGHHISSYQGCINQS